MPGMEVKLINPPQMSHTCGTSKPCQSAQTSELVSMRNCYIYIYIYIKLHFKHSIYAIHSIYHHITFFFCFDFNASILTHQFYSESCKYQVLFLLDMKCHTRELNSIVYVWSLVNSKREIEKLLVSTGA